MISGAPAREEADQKGVRACQRAACTIATHVILQTARTGGPVVTSLDIASKKSATERSDNRASKRKVAPS